jgi:hypothetical protein
MIKYLSKWQHRKNKPATRNEHTECRKYFNYKFYIIFCQWDLRVSWGSPIRFSLGLWHVLWSLRTDVLEDTAAPSFKVEVTRVSMQLSLSWLLIITSSVVLPNYRVQEFALTNFTKRLLKECMDKNVPCKHFYLNTFLLETRLMGQTCGVAISSSAINKSIANNGIISKHDASIVGQR